MPGTFYTAAAGFIDKDGKLLILKRSPKHDYEAEQWEVVSGRLENGMENVKSELQREIREELGENFKCEVIAPFGTYHFLRNNDAAQEHVGIDYVCKYISGEIQLSQEHTECRWIDPKEFGLEYSCSESIRNKIKLFGQVRDWYLSQSGIFKDYT